MSTSSTQLPHVVIVGAGFGGLRLARALKNTPVRVTLLDRNNFHLFQPLLYQVATSALSPDAIAYPVRGIFHHQKNFEFRLANVTGIHLDARRLETSAGEIAYDTLVMAVGGVTNTFGMLSVAEHSFGLKELKDATSIRNHLLQMFERAEHETDPQKRQALLTLAVAGGGPTGVECAGAMAELIHLVLLKDYPGIREEEVRVVLIEATDRLLPAMPADLSQFTRDTLKHKRVEVLFGKAVAQYDGHQLLFKDGATLDTETLVWAAGIKAAPLVAALKAEQASLGRVKVTPSLQIAERPEVYVIGDAAYLEDADGHALPMVAPVAMQQADTVAANIRRGLSGQEPRNFEYHDPGSLATIGRNAAVARLGGFKFQGFFAWWVWLFVHLMQLVGFRNRLVVLVNWAWNYIFYDRAVRLIGPE